MYRLSFLFDNKNGVCHDLKLYVYYEYRWVTERPWLRADRFDRQKLQQDLRNEFCTNCQQKHFFTSDFCVCDCACKYKPQTSGKKGT